MMQRAASLPTSAFVQSVNGDAGSERWEDKNKLVSGLRVKTTLSERMRVTRACLDGAKTGTRCPCRQGSR
jgi:hypothetical protein